MNIEQFRTYCLAKKGVTEGFPFNETTLVFKVGEKMFALCGIEPFEKVNLKCDPEEAILLREKYQAVEPGYHMNKQHWNTVGINKDVLDSHLLSMTDRSYELIFHSLSKSKQAEIKNNG